jgi:hypothetical protein
MFTRKRIEAFRATFNTTQGKEVLHYLAKEVKAYDPTHVVGDPYQTAFNEGRRAVYNHIVSILGANEELLELSFKQQESVRQLQQIVQGAQLND